MLVCIDFKIFKYFSSCILSICTFIRTFFCFCPVKSILDRKAVNFYFKKWPHFVVKLFFIKFIFLTSSNFMCFGFVDLFLPILNIDHHLRLFKVHFLSRCFSFQFIIELFQFFMSLMHFHNFFRLVLDSRLIRSDLH